ncbi:hypothetical protein JTE90_004623 [Oedothorax gibbosus]|uniref:VWFD domain-containing protein n=1 Tax=Oedothorax gibbosus TaxID=931172 RepID=A0AAV6URA8_9ARAC|nr:hypothetical protein JTE90_004623 [Oedothorax gibbosus]
MIVRMMYVLPMLLGRTYDVVTNNVGIDIFSPEDVRHPRVNPEPFYRSVSRTVEGAFEMREVLGVDAALSLALKTGAISGAARGFGAYARGASEATDSVDVLIKVSFRTVSESLPPFARPVAGWNSSKIGLGTHFVQSVLYGGDLVARVRFRANRREDMRSLRAVVDGAVSGGALDFLAEGKLESLNMSARLEIDYFASVPVVGTAHTAQGLRALVRRFEDSVRAVNGGKGVPVEVELRDLSALDSRLTRLQDTELETELGFFEEYLDDLLSTKARLKALLSPQPGLLAQKDLKQLSGLWSRTGSVLGRFYDALSALESGGGAGQLLAAREAYGGVAGKFRRELNRVISKINSTTLHQSTSRRALVSYGALNCPKGSALIHSGVAASAPRSHTGSGGDLICVPKVPEYAQKIVEAASGGRGRSKTPEYAQKNVGAPLEGRPRVAGVRFGKLDNAPFTVPPDRPLSAVACVACLIEMSTVNVFYGLSKCPQGTWVLLHTGHVMSGGSGAQACVDPRLEVVVGGGGARGEQTFEFAVSQQGEVVPCAVCAK